MAELDLSIIVPTFNRAAMLATTLESVASAVPSNHRLEIIVIDNGSQDHTANVCREIKALFPKHNWRYFYDDMPGLLSGRHRGAKEGQGEVLAFLDDDVSLEPSWWDALQDAFSDPEVMLTGGPSFPKYETEPPSWLDGQWVELEGGRSCSALSLIDLGPVKRAIDPCYVWGLNFSIRKTAFELCGGFNPDCMPKPLQRYQGDGEFGLALKIKAHALKALYHPRLALQHIIPASRLTPESFEQRGFYQGVCDSYAQIRRDRTTAPDWPSWKEFLRPAKWKIKRKLILRNPTADGVRQLMARAHCAGMQFHQNEALKDLRLLAWILKPDYFDYGLPDGWERYLTKQLAKVHECDFVAEAPHV